jgi:hypothetical protein
MHTNTATKSARKTPSHVAYNVRERDGKESFWTNIGAAWPHADGKGFNIELNSIPLDGRISLRLTAEKNQ